MCTYNLIRKKKDETRIIKKFTLGNTKNAVEVPKDAQVISATIVEGKPTLFMLVNENAPKVVRTFHVLGAAKTMPEGELTFIATISLLGDGLFGHVFEEIDTECAITEAA